MLFSIIRNYAEISKSYRIDFLDPSENVLCEVTNMVTDDSLWVTLGKSRKQEDEYCIIANKNTDNFVTDITVQEKATSNMIQQKYSDKRFIRLQATDDPSSGGWVDEEVANAKPPSTPSAPKKK